MTLQPNNSSNGRISPLVVRSLGCLGSASLLSSSLIINGLALAQEAIDAPLEPAPIAAIEPAYVEPEPVYVEPEPVYIPQAEPAATYVEPEPAYEEPAYYEAPVAYEEPAYYEEPVYEEPAYEAPLPAPILESPVVNLTPQDLEPAQVYQDYAAETQVETVFDAPLEDYAPRPELAPVESAGGNFIDDSDLYSTGATGSEAVYAEDAELLSNPEVIVNEPSVNQPGTPNVTPAGVAAPAEAVAGSPTEAVAGSPASVDAPLTADAAQAAPTNVSPEQAAKIQTAVQPTLNNPGRNGHLPAPASAATTEIAGSATHNNGYSVTYPTSSPLGVAVHSLGQNLAPSLNIGSYFARTQRPNAVQGNGDRQLLFPLSMPAPISSVFGWRTHPIFGNRRFHSGTDLAAEQGTPIVATLSGKTSTADFVGGYGLTVVLDHADGKHQTLYGHMSEIYVQPGQIVRQGEVIGRVGSTGNSTGPHLHFEIRELTNDGWVAIDPGRFLEGSIAQLMQLLRNQPMQPISIAQIPIKLSPGQLAGVQPQQKQQQQPVKLATGLKPLLQKQNEISFKPMTPLEQKVVEVVKALEGSAPVGSALAPSSVSFPASQTELSYTIPKQAPIVSQAALLKQNEVQ